MVSSNETFPHQVRGCTCHGVRLPVSKEALMAWLLTTYSLGSYSHDLDCCLKEFVFLFREDFQLQEYMYIYIIIEPPSELRTIRFIRNGPLTLQGCERHAKRWGPHPKRCPRKSCPQALYISLEADQAACATCLL